MRITPLPGLDVDQLAEELAQAVQARLEQGEGIAAVRALIQELDLFRLALETWQGTQDERFRQLI